MSAMRTPDRTSGAVTGSKRGARALAVLGATAGALIVWLIAGPLAGVDLRADTGGAQPQQVTAVSVLVVGLLVGLAGWALLAVLERFTARARTIWTVVAVLVLVVSLLGPLGAVGGAATLAMACMHLVVGAVLIPLLAGTSARRAGRPA